MGRRHISTGGEVDQLVLICTPRTTPSRFIPLNPGHSGLAIVSGSTSATAVAAAASGFSTFSVATAGAAGGFSAPLVLAGTGSAGAAAAGAGTAGAMASGP